MSRSPTTTDVESRTGAAAFAAVFVAASLFIVARLGLELGTIPIDGCYYVAKARSFGETGQLRVPWGDGLDTKFLPGVSILFAAPLRLFGEPWGWILTEAGCLAGAVALVFALAGRLGAGPAGRCAAAVAFAVDPLVVKWASVPYAEIPAVFTTLASVEGAFRAREGTRRKRGEVFAALLLGIAATMRIEAWAALPVVALLAASGRTRGRAAARALLSAMLAFVPFGIHIGALALRGVAPSGLHYVGEFARHFDVRKYLDNVGGFFLELGHRVPPKRDVLEGMPVLLGIGQAAARVVVLALGATGALVALRRREGRIALAILVAFPIVHALWHYFDGRFLLVAWPLVSILTGLGTEFLLQAAWGAARFAVAVPAVATALVLLWTGLHVAHKEISRWENVTAGSARELAARVDALVGSDAEGLYEFDEGGPRVLTGPYVAVHRRARARFAFRLPEFFEADVEPEAVPELLLSGNRFVLTNVSFPTWLARSVPDARERTRFRALLEEEGRTVVVARR